MAFRPYRTRVAVAAVVCAGGVWSGPSPAPAVVTPVTGVVFNDPNDAVRKHAVSNQLRTLIQSANSGSTIRIAIFEFGDASIRDALLGARTRNVNVQVVADSRSAAGISTEIWASLQRALRTDKTKSSWAITCPLNQACVGTASPGDELMHNKFALFSSVGGATNVVFQSTANFYADLPGGSGDGNWNNAVTVVGNAGLYNSYFGYFTDLKNFRSDTDYYDTRPAQPFGSVKPYYFPRAGSSPSTDTIVSILGNVDCTKRNSATGTSIGQTIVRVAMAAFTRYDVSEKLRTMDNAGCYVEVVYRDDAVGAGVKADLLNRSGPYNGIRSWYFPASTVRTLHSKYLAIEGNYAGAANQKVVWTGSHNYTYPALRANDEVLLRIDGAAFHDAFRQNFRDMAYRAPGIVANPY